MEFSIGFAAIFVGANGFDLRGRGAEQFRVDWGDGTSEDVGLNTDTDGDTILDAADASHQYALDGVYEVRMVDKPNDPSTPNFSARAYMYFNDPDGSVATGTNGFDIFCTGEGADLINGKDGDDWAIGNGGNDTINGGGGGDFLIGEDGIDFISGGSGSDLISGGLQDDNIKGDAGYDYLYGDEGRDRIDAGSEGAYMDGGLGRDILIGGSGEDVFAFGDALHSPKNDGDEIRSFVQGQDEIYVFGAFGGGFDFIGEQAFSGTGVGELRYVSGVSTKVYGDVNGDGRIDFEFKIGGDLELTSEDFGIFMI